MMKAGSTVTDFQLLAISNYIEETGSTVQPQNQKTCWRFGASPFLHVGTTQNYQISFALSILSCHPSCSLNGHVSIAPYHEAARLYSFEGVSYRT